MSLDIEINSKIRLDNQSRLKEMNKKKDCWGVKKEKLIKLKMILLGCNGVGKASIIKTIRGNENINNFIHTKKRI